MLTPWKESYSQPRWHIENQRHYFANKGQSSQGYGFSSGHVWMWELDCEESWAQKNWCFRAVVLEKTLESPLDCKEIQPAHPKGDQSLVFIGRTDAEAETPILCPPHAKSWFIGKDPDAGRDWGQEEKGMAEDEMAEWHHSLDGHEFEQAPGAGDGQRGLVCFSPWGCKEWHVTERLNWTALCREGWVFKTNIYTHTHTYMCCVLGHVTSLQPFGLWPSRFLCPRNFLSEITRVGCHSLLQRIFQTQRSNLHLLCLLHCSQILYYWVIKKYINIYIYVCVCVYIYIHTHMYI